MCIEDCFCTFGIVSDVCFFAFFRITEDLGSENRVCSGCIVFHHISYKAFFINGHCDCFSEFGFCHNIVYIGSAAETEIIDLCCIGSFNSYTVDAFNTGDLLNGKVGHEVCFAGFHTCDCSGFFSDDGHGYVFDCRCAVPVFFVSGKNYVGTGDGAYKFIRTGTAGVYHKVLALLCSRRNDCGVGVCKFCKDNTVFIVEVENDGVFVGAFHGFDGVCDGSTCRTEFRVFDEAEGVHYSFGVKIGAIVEFNAFTKFNSYGHSVFGELRKFSSKKGIIFTGNGVDSVKGFVDLSVYISGSAVVGTKRIKAGERCSKSDFEHSADFGVAAFISIAANRSVGVNGGGCAVASSKESEAHYHCDHDAKKFFHDTFLLFLFFIAMS